MPANNVGPINIQIGLVGNKQVEQSLNQTIAAIQAAAEKAGAAQKKVAKDTGISAQKMNYAMSAAVVGIEDFFAVYSTGGTGAGFRAASNNIAQAGRILSPGLLGAFAGVAVTMGSVFIPKLFETATGTEKVNAQLLLLKQRLEDIEFFENRRAKKKDADESFEKTVKGTDSDSLKEALKEREDAIAELTRQRDDLQNAFADHESFFSAKDPLLKAAEDFKSSVDGMMAKTFFGDDFATQFMHKATAEFLAELKEGTRELSGTIEQDLADHLQKELERLEREIREKGNILKPGEWDVGNELVFGPGGNTGGLNAGYSLDPHAVKEAQRKFLEAAAKARREAVAEVSSASEDSALAETREMEREHLIDMAERAAELLRKDEERIKLLERLAELRKQEAAEVERMGLSGDKYSLKQATKMQKQQQENAKIQQERLQAHERFADQLREAQLRAAGESPEANAEKAVEAVRKQFEQLEESRKKARDSRGKATDPVGAQLVKDAQNATAKRLEEDLIRDIAAAEKRLKGSPVNNTTQGGLGTSNAMQTFLDAQMAQLNGQEKDKEQIKKLEDLRKELVEIRKLFGKRGEQFIKVGK